MIRLNKYISTDTYNVVGKSTIKVLYKPDPEPKIGEEVIIDNTLFCVRALEKKWLLMHPPIPGNMIGVVVEIKGTKENKTRVL